MPSIHEAIRSFLYDERWAHEALAGEPVFRVFYQGENGRLICFAQARDTERQLVFYSYSPESAPEDKRPALAEFLTRANYGLVLGNFEMDLNDGEVRFKTSIDVDQVELTTGLIRPIVYANVLTMDQYLPGIMAVIQTSATPAEALAAILLGNSAAGPTEDSPG